jgi:hypothetical protein
MANKLILVPESMYKSLISQISTNNNEYITPSTKLNDDNLNLDFVKKNLDKAKKTRSKNLSSKNVNYNQELRRYLRLKKHTNDQPMKVKLSNGLCL